jgi:hypothetical protein
MVAGDRHDLHFLSLLSGIFLLLSVVPHVSVNFSARGFFFLSIAFRLVLVFRLPYNGLFSM